MATRKRTPATPKKTSSDKKAGSNANKKTVSVDSSRPGRAPATSPTRAAPAAPPVEIRPYKHAGGLLDDFLAKYPNGVYFHLDKVSKHENESAIKSLDPTRPCIVVGKSFTASELQALGFKVFQNGPNGKLIGTRGV